MTNLTNSTWWKDAALRALYTAFAIALPYLGGAIIADVPWLTIVSAAVLGFVASLATSLAGLPESSGVDLPWWLAALERVAKTFAQALATGFLGATMLADVAWSTVLQASLLAALASLVRLILATLPADPTAKAPSHVTIVNERPVGRIASDMMVTDAAKAAVDKTGQGIYPRT